MIPDEKKELVRCYNCGAPAIHTTSEMAQIDHFQFALTPEERERVVGMLLLYDANDWARTIIQKLRVGDD